MRVSPRMGWPRAGTCFVDFRLVRAWCADVESAMGQRGQTIKYVASRGVQLYVQYAAQAVRVLFVK